MFGVAILVAVFASTGSYATPGAFIDGFAPAAGVCALFAAFAALAGMSLPRRHIARSVGVSTVAPASTAELTPQA